ncbi:putative cysteine-rich repeat secretory protein 21 [Vitis riparia]|uniref:putative cysteine-rich repeat secretory protein 21 n=1 Tax=Vitis riparia TaxID=96939 RepID=UPI00155A2835|nr:putative cysteine-rich repeat secretory protein 21 [Vitis riparia]
MAMASLGRLFFISCILTNLVPSTVAHQLITPFCLPERGNYTNGSSYQANLSSLLTSFSNTTVDYGFYHSSAGEVKGIGFCRGDIGPDKCRSCMNTSSHERRRLCPNSKEAIIYYDICTLRYSNRSIFGTWELHPHLQQPNSENFWEVNGSNQVGIFESMQQENKSTLKLYMQLFSAVLMYQSSNALTVWMRFLRLFLCI